MPAFPKNNLGGKTWANVMNENDGKAPPVKRRATRKASPRRASSRNSGPNTRNVRQMRSSFKRLYNRNPNSYIKSRRRRQGRPSKSKSPSPRRLPARRGLTPERRRPANHGSRSHGHAHANHSARSHGRAEPGPRPRAGKVMRECLRDCEEEGCQRHKDTADCKFIHKGEPEYNMLRPDQKHNKKKGGFAISSPAPLSSVNTYTSWPGGVDPTARLFNQAAML